MARRVTRIEPRHDRLRLRGRGVREDERRVPSWLQTLGINREESRIQCCSIRVEDSDQVMLGHVLRQDEPVGSRRQYASGNLNRLVKRDFGGLFRLICLCSRQRDQECK